MARPVRVDPRVDLGVFAVCGVVSLVCLVLPTSAREKGAGALRGTIVAPLAGLQAKSEIARRSLTAGSASARAADSISLRSLRLDGVEQENERLRKLLGLASALRWGSVPAEALQGRGVGDETRIALSAGADAGVTPLSPVVTAEGLVGMVEQVDRTLSLAIVWPHPDFRVSAMAADGSAYGIIRAHSGQDASRYFLELQGVAFRNQVKAGTLIVASGLGGVYPRGIPIGTVVQEIKSGEGYARSYLVRPVVRLPDVNYVLILRPDRTKGPMENVWERPMNADSAAKALTAAGDSIKARADAAHRDSIARAVARDTTKPAPQRP